MRRVHYPFLAALLVVGTAGTALLSTAAQLRAGQVEAGIIAVAAVSVLIVSVVGAWLFRAVARAERRRLTAGRPAGRRSGGNGE